MSTRARIGVFTDGSRYRANYHHFDGYPTGLGRALWGLYKGHFNQDLGAMLKVLIDDHPAGWSTIQDRDWSLEPGYDSKRSGRPECYCHGDRDEDVDMRTTGDVRLDTEYDGAPYLYLFRENEMRIYKYDRDLKCYARIARLDLQASTEPDWVAIEKSN